MKRSEAAKSAAEVKCKALQLKAETSSLVAKNAALHELGQLDKEDCLHPLIDCSGIFVLIGPNMIELEIQTSSCKTSSFEKHHPLKYCE